MCLASPCGLGESLFIIFRSIFNMKISAVVAGIPYYWDIPNTMHIGLSSTSTSMIFGNAYCSSGPEPDKHIHYEQFYKLKSTSMISGNDYCSSDPEPDKY